MKRNATFRPASTGVDNQSQATTNDQDPKKQVVTSHSVSNTVPNISQILHGYRFIRKNTDENAKINDGYKRIEKIRTEE